MQKYYNILGLQHGASKTQIKRAYRRLAMTYHPDRNKSPQARKIFMQIDRAYDALYNGRYPSTSSYKKRKKKREQTPFEKWAKVQHPPTNLKDHAAWAKVKKQQMREAKQERKSKQSFNYKRMYLMRMKAKRMRMQNPSVYWIYVTAFYYMFSILSLSSLFCIGLIVYCFTINKGGAFFAIIHPLVGTAFGARSFYKDSMTYLFIKP